MTPIATAFKSDVTFCGGLPTPTLQLPVGEVMNNQFIQGNE